MANLKEYQIKINGIQETINAVDSLNKQLETLESRIKALEGKAVNISSGGGSKSETSEKAKLEEQIAKNAEKIALARTEEYKALLMQKQILKEINNEQKASIAGDKLGDHSYNLNTMAGMKERLRDIKSAMQTTDINSDMFQQLTKEAGELNSKLKELEQNYGQFGRNVGNYANGVTEGIKNAKQELRELKTELQNLSVKKDRGIITPEEEERLKSVTNEYAQLKSSVEDAGKPMDNLMDTMQSIVAIAQTAKGFSAFFDIDEAKFQQTVQKLVALQNMMQGIQTLSKQMQTGEGIGAIFVGLDNFAVKAQNGSKALQGLGKAATFASTAIKGIGKAFVWLQVAMVAWDVIKGFFESTENEAPRAVNRMQELANTMKEMRNTYIDAQISNQNLASRLSHLQIAYKNTNDELKKTTILKEAAKEFKNLGIQVNSVNQAQKILVDKGQDVIDMIREQGKVAALSALRMEAYQKSFKMLMEDGYDVKAASILAGYNGMVQQFDKLIDESNTKIAEYQKKLGIKDGGNSAKSDSRVKAEEVIQELTLKLMQDGLRKKLIQLDNEKNKTLAKVKGTEEQKLHIIKQYNELALKEVKDYSDKVQKELKSYSDNIKQTKDDLEMMNIELLRSNTQQGYESIIYDFEAELAYFKNFLKVVDDAGYEIVDKYGFLEQIQKAYYNNYIERLIEFEDREHQLALTAAAISKEQAEKAAKEEFDAQYKKREELLETIEELDKRILENGDKMSAEELNNLKEERDKLLKEYGEYYQNAIQAENNFTEKMCLIENQYLNDINEINLKSFDEKDKIYHRYYDGILKTYDSFLESLRRRDSSQPTRNSAGFFNLTTEKSNIKQNIEDAKALLSGLSKSFMEVEQKYKDGIITKEVAESTLYNISILENEVEEELKTFRNKLADNFASWWTEYDRYVQAVGQATNSILSSLSDITNNKYDKLIDEQEKYIDKFSDLLDKQKEKTQQYADAVNNIEGELSDARGDRRQQLIDQLNAEMAAQRASLEQEKRIEKEKEKAEHRKEQLEYDQAVARKKMDEAQALINGVMAASMAAVNRWPLPALPMIALATATAAAQYAAVRSQYIPKPSTYADGGVIQGKSHRDGGVPVMGGRAEVEGGEFITNKVTTANNTDLLQFINSKRKRVDISDLIDFYSSGKPSKNITGIRTKFADGGQLPLLRNDISMNDRILAAIEDYSNKPTVVQVVDIIDRTQKLNEVKVISGLEV